MDAKTALESLEISVLVLKAFPTLMNQLAPLTVTWSSQFAADPRFVAAVADAAKQITEMACLVNAPLYKRPSTLTS